MEWFRYAGRTSFLAHSPMNVMKLIIFHVFASRRSQRSQTEVVQHASLSRRSFICCPISIVIIPLFFAFHIWAINDTCIAQLMFAHKKISVFSEENAQKERKTKQTT